jgi:hypothetical protein
VPGLRPVQILTIDTRRAIPVSGSIGEIGKSLFLFPEPVKEVAGVCAEMERIAELIKEVIIDQKDVREELHQFRMDCQEVKHSYDDHATGSGQAVLRAAK